MATKITNTPIAVDYYGSLALRQMRHQSHSNCVMQPDGTLWVAVPNEAGTLNVYRSTDQGFSWSRVIRATGVSNRWNTGVSTTKGPLYFILIDERYRNLDLIGVEWENVGSTFDINRSRYDLDDITASPSNTLIDSLLEASRGITDICYTHSQGHFIFNDGSSNISIRQMTPRSSGISSAVDRADGVVAAGMGAICDEDNKIYCTYTKTAINSVRFAIFDDTPNTWSSPVTVHNLGQTDRFGDDLVISIDGLGNLCIAYANRDTSAGTAVLTYAISTNGGGSWTVTAVTRESGFSVYTEPVNFLPTMYVDMIASSQGGFIMTYCDKEDADGLGHTFVRQLTTSDDGATYDLGSQKEIGTRYDGRDVIGGHFFRPTTIKLLDLTDPGIARLAYTVDEGNDEDGDDDKIPVTFAQELLSEVAFPSVASIDTGSYTQDTADSISLLVKVNIVGSAEDNVDFAALGLTGRHTTSYTDAFNKVGTRIRLQKFEPDVDNTMNDRSAYDAPAESTALALFDSKSYTFPIPPLAASDTDAWVEKDVRKLFLPADIHLARTFTVNAGGYLKRTVWLALYGGNTYELSQVIPHFISNEICYYEVNAYVVGPSRDPFSRTVLPSET